MRIPRRLQLFDDNGSVHKYWRCHNRSFLLSESHIKDLYLKCTEYALNHASVRNNIKLSSFCIMNNHVHMQTQYKKCSSYLSQFMRISHSRFGFSYNRIHKSSGKVANERPQTPLIEDPTHDMRVQFYIEANPIRAGFRKLENLHIYKYSSYGFYAYGKKTQWTHLLTIPDWYLKLGQTASERQKVYRKLFKEYLEQDIDSSEMLRPFIGTLVWVYQKKEVTKKRIKQLTASPP